MSIPPQNFNDRAGVMCQASEHGYVPFPHGYGDGNGFLRSLRQGDAGGEDRRARVDEHE